MLRKNKIFGLQFDKWCINFNCDIVDYIGDDPKLVNRLDLMFTPSSKKFIQMNTFLQKPRCQWTHHDPMCCVLWACGLHLGNLSLLLVKTHTQIVDSEMYSPPIKSLNATFIIGSLWWRPQQVQWTSNSTSFSIKMPMPLWLHVITFAPSHAKPIILDGD